MVPTGVHPARSSRAPRLTPIVFVVDDDLSIREALDALIRSAGWEAETYASARDFLARPPETPYGVLRTLGPGAWRAVCLGSARMSEHPR
jgi:hypothetical protein